MNYDAEMWPGAMIYVPSIVKIRSGTWKSMGVDVAEHAECRGMTRTFITRKLGYRRLHRIQNTSNIPIHYITNY
jgi:hypothetical protein